MSLFRKEYKISVCIPVYGTEDVLMSCLKSVESQTINKINPDFVEIVLVDDCSPEKSAKEIVKKFKKSCKIPVNYIRHESNKGLVEARRTAIYAAKGKYIFNLDSDDTLPPDALIKLYEKAESSGTDIVQGKAKVFFEKQKNQLENSEQQLEELKLYREQQVNHIFPGELNNLPEKNEILDGYLLEKNHMGFLWGKLILRETYLNAFNHIPPIECTMCEDIIQYVWLCYEAKKYASIDSIVYNYSINTGISSRSIIDNLDRWKMVCSTSGVFTSLYDAFENPEVHFTDEEKNQIRNICLHHLQNNLFQWKQAVSPEIKSEAYEMLCDYWGESFVEKVKEASDL